MKKIILAIIIAFALYSCKKETLPFIQGSIPPEDTAGGSGFSDYQGSYHGLVNDREVFADSRPFVKFDTIYEFTMTVIDLGEPGGNLINIRGTQNVDSIVVDESGKFSFVDFHRTISGRFVAPDSMYMYMTAVGGAFPLYYKSSHMEFAGAKQ